MATDERYARQIMLPDFGEEGQRRLREASVLVVGVGGLGSAAATCLAAAGVGHIGLADPDVVSLSNLQRQTLYTTAEVDLPKTECARRRLSALNPEVRFTLHPEGITAENAGILANAYDLMVDCTDNYPARYLIDDACAAAGKPWVHGSIGEFQGRVAVMNHLRGRRYSDLFPEREALCSQPRATAGVLGAVPAVIGAIEANEALKLLTSIGEPLDGRLFCLDLLTLESFTLDF